MAITMTDPYYESLKRFSVCPICGKKFIPAAQHAWCIGGWDSVHGERNQRVCSYTCMRKWEKEQEHLDKERHKDSKNSKYVPRKRRDK